MIPTTTTSTSIRKARLYPNAPWYFALAILVTWVGFSLSYFTRLTEVNIFHHLHGASAGLWMTLLVIQPILYLRGQLRLHRRLGWLGVLVLAPMLVLGGLKMMHQILQAPTSKRPQTSELFPVIYQSIYYDLILLVMFVAFLGLSVWHGKRVALHARYIVCTVLVILPAALFRIFFFFVPGFDSIAQSLHGSLVVIELILLLLLLDDRRYGSIRRPYLLALGLFVFLSMTMSLVSDWRWWRAVTDWFSAL